jgi:uncharacterized membrane protein
MQVSPEYTAFAHMFLTILGLVLLVVIVFTLRAETGFLVQHREHRVQFVLSVISMCVMVFLTLTCLFHWVLSPVTTLLTVMTSVLVLLILAPTILLLRARAFVGLAKDRREERRRLIDEVLDMIDEKKRQKIRDGKRKRGEELEE